LWEYNPNLEIVTCIERNIVGVEGKFPLKKFYLKSKEISNLVIPACLAFSVFYQHTGTQLSFLLIASLIKNPKLI